MMNMQNLASISTEFLQGGGGGGGAKVKKIKNLGQ